MAMNVAERFCSCRLSREPLKLGISYLRTRKLRNGFSKQTELWNSGGNLYYREALSNERGGRCGRTLREQ